MASDLHGARWITCDATVETPLFRKTFWAGASMRGEIDISGLGFFTLLVNGRRVTKDLFTPAFTNYAPRDTARFHYPIYDTLSCRVLYLHYDITPFLLPGDNTVDVIVGNGWYRQRERIAEGYVSYGETLLTAFAITLTDEGGQVSRICTDGSEAGFIYPILESNLYLGETLDTRALGAPLPAIPVRLSDFVPQRLLVQKCPPDREIRCITPRCIVSQRERRVYDAGENITGTARLTVQGEAGAVLTLRYAEEMQGDQMDFTSTGGRLRVASGRAQVQSDSYILSGKPQTLETMFVYHAFRYVEVVGDARVDVLEIPVIHTQAAVTSTFHCDHEALNWLYDAYLRTQLNNFHHAIPSDCPHRERLGYTGDGQCCAQTAMLTLDCRGIYEKWIEDILDCQGLETGHVQHTAPFMGGGGGPGGWGSAIVLVPYQHYRRYGDEGILRRTYPAMCRWLEYMMTRCEEHLVVREEDGGWCLGDWASPDEMRIPTPFVNTCYLVSCIDIVAHIALLLHREVPAAWTDFARESRKALCRAYFDGEDYAGGIQGANAFAVWARLPQYEKLPARLAVKYEGAPLDTGFLGADLLCETLFEHGYGAVALRLMGEEDPHCGFGMMRARGATTLYEYLHTATHSQNHPMFGACVRQLFTGLLGVIQTEGAGYQQLCIAPALDTGVRAAEGSLRLNQGDLKVAFSLDQREICITLPRGIRAVCRVGNKEIPLTEGSQRIRIDL